jgi:peptidoglycan hydrolase CwlO-like protein
MTLSFIILAQSVTGAVITIVALLLVAAIIGYLTAWFYAKSVYIPIIKALEAEKADLQKQVAGLKEDVSRLNSKVDELNGKIRKLEEELGAKEKEIKDLRSKIKE